jgi:hypothetical protein
MSGGKPCHTLYVLKTIHLGSKQYEMFRHARGPTTVRENGLNKQCSSTAQATGSVMNRVQDSAIFRRLIGIGALLPPSIQTPGPSTVSINLMRQLMGLVPGPYSIIASYAGDQNFQPSYAGSNFAIDITCALPANPIG